MNFTTLDTETCGFHGVAVLLQYAFDDGPVSLHELWCEPIEDTLELIEIICQGAVLGFNLTFDWFHLQKIYNLFLLLGEEYGFDREPRDLIYEAAALEADARSGPCIKPASACDLMLHARKGPYQMTMDRKPITIRKVPKVIAESMIKHLEEELVLPDIMFAKNKKPDRWKIRQVSQDLVDIVLKFNPSTSLKALVKHIGLNKGRLLFSELEHLKKPAEVGWAPFASAIANKSWTDSEGRPTWPILINDHIYQWRYHETARAYAEDDVLDTRNLYYHFDSPDFGDDDSILACMLGSVRWRGYAIDIEGLTQLRDEWKPLAKSAPRAPQQAKAYISQVMSDVEQEVFIDKDTGKETSKKVVLESITKWKKDCSCLRTVWKTKQSELGTSKVKTSEPDPSCKLCSGTGELDHPAALRAKSVAEARKAMYKIGIFNKLIKAGRFHASGSVVGSLSGRMSGSTETDSGKAKGLNALGIEKDKRVRSKFNLADEGYVLSGGDFSAYEVSIAEACYDDPKLRSDLLTCYKCGHESTPDQYRESETCPKCGEQDSRRKIHGLFGMQLSGMTYEEVVASDGKDPDWYTRGKGGVFSQFYGGDDNTLVRRTGVDLETAQKASFGFKEEYQGIGREYARIEADHCSMQQPGGIGTQVVWNEPAEYIESLTGFRRYFTLENHICRVLFDLANDPPKEWSKHKFRITRRERSQTVSGAGRTCLFAAAFGLQASCMRAALNHKIQSTGAILTKELQREIWDEQPVGISPWVVQPINIHDEIMCPNTIPDRLEEIVVSFVQRRKSLVPLLKIEWVRHLQNWSEK